LYITTEPLVKVIDEIDFPLATEIKIPEYKVTPDNPKSDSNEEPFSSNIADTTASALTTKPCQFPVFALVLLTTLLPVKPLINSVAELILIYSVFKFLALFY
jgi:hypothetical protein